MIRERQAEGCRIASRAIAAGSPDGLRGKRRPRSAAPKRAAAAVPRPQDGRPQASAPSPVPSGRFCCWSFRFSGDRRPDGLYDCTGKSTTVRAEGTFYPGIYVNDVSLYGASPQEAYDFLLAQAREKMANWSLTLAYGEQSWTITTDTLGMTQNLEAAIRDAVNEAHAIGREASFLDSYRTVLSLKSEEYRIYTNNIRQNEEMLDAMLMDIKTSSTSSRKTRSASSTPAATTPSISRPRWSACPLDIISLKEEILRRADAMEAGVIELQPETFSRRLPARCWKARLSAWPITPPSSAPAAPKDARPTSSCPAAGSTAWSSRTASASASTPLPASARWENGYQSAPEIVSGQYQDGVGRRHLPDLFHAVQRGRAGGAGGRGPQQPRHPGQLFAPGADGHRSPTTAATSSVPPQYRRGYLHRGQVVKENSKTICLFQIYGRPDPHGYTYELAPRDYRDHPHSRGTARGEGYAGHPRDLSRRDGAGENGSEGYKVQSYLVTRDSAGQCGQRRSV